MRNLFKKSLAICLAIALCLTAMVGLTVSADEAVPSEIVAENVTVKEGATSATFDVTFKAADLSEVMLTITTDATVDNIACVTNDNYELYYQGGNQFFFSTKKVDTTTETAINEATATITLTFEALAAATSFDVKIDLPEGYAATDKELLIAAATKTITVTAETAEAPHVHTQGELISATPAVDGGENGEIVFDCTTCDEDIVEEVTYRAYSILDTPQIGCTSKTELIFRTPSVAVSGYSEGIFTYTQTYVSGNTNIVALPVSDEYKTSYGYEWPTAVPYSGFTEEYDTAIYLKFDGVWTNGGNSVRSIKGLVMDNIIKYAGIDEDMKKVAANLLYAGARTQEAFSYGADNLADSDLVGEYASYVTTTEPTLDKTSGVNYTDFPADYQGKALFDTPSIVLGDSVAIRHTVRLNFYSGAKDDIKLKYEYTTFDNVVKSDYLTVEATDENTYVFDLGVNAPDMRSVVNFTIYNGDTAIGDVSPYSIEAVMKATVDSNIYVDVINAVMNYSDSALNYFS